MPQAKATSTSLWGGNWMSVGLKVTCEEKIQRLTFRKPGFEDKLRCGPSDKRKNLLSWNVLIQSVLKPFIFDFYFFKVREMYLSVG